MLVVVAPGQGSQAPGMLSAWLDRPGAAAEVAACSELTGLDLAALGTTGDADTVRDTAHAQPLLIIAGLLSMTALAAAADLPRDQVGDLLAGHSVGELTVLAVAEIVPDDEAVQLAAIRGAAMAEASLDPPGGMSAVLGGDPVVVSERLIELGLTAANVNAAGQIVAAGALDRLAELAANPPAGARVRPLPVAGPFHTAQMAPAAETLTAVAQQVQVRAGRTSTAVVGNLDGAVYVDARHLFDTVIGQVARPVRWDAVQRHLVSLGVTGLLELAPAGTLTGLARREMPGVATFALKSPADLPAAAAFVAEHRIRWTTPPERGVVPGPGVTPVSAPADGAAADQQNGRGAAGAAVPSPYPAGPRRTATAEPTRTEETP